MGGGHERASQLPLDIAALRRRIRDIPDFPEPGIIFRDITPPVSYTHLTLPTICSV